MIRTAKIATIELRDAAVLGPIPTSLSGQVDRHLSATLGRAPAN